MIGILHHIERISTLPLVAAFGWSLKTDVNSKMSGKVKEKSLHGTLCSNKLNLDSSLKCGLLFPLRKEIAQGENENPLQGYLKLEDQDIVYVKIRGRKEGKVVAQ